MCSPEHWTDCLDALMRAMLLSLNNLLSVARGPLARRAGTVGGWVQVWAGRGGQSVCFSCAKQNPALH